MFFLFKTFVLCYFIFACYLFVEATPFKIEHNFDQPLYLNVSFRETVGKGIDKIPSYTTLQAFLAFPPSKTNLFSSFIDVRGHYLQNEKWAGNFGTGVRYHNFSLKNIVGISVFYDFREMHSCHFQQIGSCFELLNSAYNFRLNGYFPFGHQIDSNHPVIFTYPGGYRAKCQEHRRALCGGDMEIETRFKRWVKSSPFDFDLAWGVYYYRDPIAHSNIGGNRIRLQYDIFLFK